LLQLKSPELQPVVSLVSDGKDHVHFWKRIRRSEFFAEEIEGFGGEIKRELSIFFHSCRSVDTNRNACCSLGFNVAEISNNKSKEL
jgi:hypothetical protein